MKRLAKILVSCAIATIIIGCASSTPSRFYTLSATSGPAVIPQADYSVSVGPVTVPSLVDRPQIVTRTGPNQVYVEEFERWAYPLKEDIGRVIVKNLIALLGTTQVTLFPQSTAAGASYRIMIDILHFDSVPGKEATLDAIWAVTSTRSGQSHRGRTTLSEVAQGSDYAALVAAHSRALDQLSTDIAKVIQGIEAQKL